MKLTERFRRLTIWNKLGVLGALASLASFAAMFFLAKGEPAVEPRYAIDWHDVIAESTADVPELTLSWKGRQLSSLRRVRIGIWNQGTRYLDKPQISRTDPIKIEYPKGIEVLSARFTYTSRPSLELAALVTDEGERQAIIVDIVGDDALESMEGGILSILYTKTKGFGPFGDVRGDLFGPALTDFEVTGRIKGSQGGFQRVPWKDATTPAWLSWIFGSIFLLHVVFVIFVGFRASREPAKPHEVMLGVLGLLLSLALSSLATYHYFAQSGGPAWIR
jgi:hypothetical protein